MRRKRKCLAAVVAALCVASAAAVPDRLSEPRVEAPAGRSPARVATLQHDPQFILEAVARRMGVRLQPDMPPPAIRLESGTPLQRMQAAAEKQWGFRPPVFVTTYATATNEIYLIDEAALYERYRRTLDDSLAHELVHYIQARYLGDRFHTEWSEVEAVAIQTWFREQFMAGRTAPVFGREPSAATAGGSNPVF
jgi:hypothetical protein